MKHLKPYKIFESKTDEENYLELSKILQYEIFDDMDIYYYDTEEDGENDKKDFDFWEWNYDIDGNIRGMNVRIAGNRKNMKRKDRRRLLFETLEKYKEAIESQLDLKITFYLSNDKHYINIYIR